VLQKENVPKLTSFFTFYIAIEPTRVLKDKKRKDQAQITSVVAKESPFMAPSRPIPNLIPQQQQQQQPTATATAAAFENPSTNANTSDMEGSPLAVPNLGPYLQFNPQIPMYTNQPNSKRWVLQAVTQSIREIIGPVVDRSVAIASVSTRELVAKDFAVESDEIKMRRAAHLMAQSLAGSLAMVTCKDPLQNSMANHMRTLFMSNGLSEAVAEQAAVLTAADNLELACAVVEKTAMEKVIMEVDEALLAAYTNRKKHRDQRTGQPYFDMEIFSAARYPSNLPEPLCPKPSGLLPAQLRVYEDFTRIPRSAGASAGQMMDQERTLRTNMMNRPDVYGNYNNTPTSFDGNQQQQQQQQQASAHQILERFAQYVNELDKLLSVTNVTGFNSLPMQHDIVTLVRHIPLLAMSSFDKAEAARTFAQKVVQLLYKSETQLSRETYVILLERLCEVSPNVGVLVTSWLTHADDERKYNVPVTMALIKANLIDLPEQDQELAILIDSGRMSAIDFTARLIRACLFGETPLAGRQDFMASLEALHRLRGNIPDSVLLLMEEMRRRATSNLPVAPQPMLDGNDLQDEAGIEERLHFFFTEWVRLYQHPSTTEKTLDAFVLQLSQQGIFKMEDVSSLFYRFCIETSIEHAIKYKQLPGQSPGLAYQPIDAFSKLVVCLLKLQNQNDANQDAARVTMFTKILSIIVLVAAQHHEQRKQQFNQRPFLRLFTSFFSDLHAVEQQIQSIYLSLLTAISNTLHTLQPCQFPGLTFAWLQLTSHRLFMPKLLLAEDQKVRI
jgi:CCR4-NOT transcription complex subunit 1